jgi:DNA-binding CsgD family transcriptional regulator
VSGAHEVVGRAEELAALGTLLGRARTRSGPAVAALVGEPGIGKTRLLAEAARLVAGMRVFRLVGYEPERQVPLGAAADLLRRLSRAGAEGERLAALLAAEMPDESGLEALRVFEAAYRVLTTMAPAVLIVDDVQWADELSLALTHYLLRAADADEVTVVALCGARPTAESETFLRSIGELIEDESRVLRLSLGPLDRPAGIRLAQNVNPALDETVAEKLWSTGAGSPFWIEMAGRASSLPDEHGSVIAASLRGLSPDGGSGLAGLVVAGRPAGVAELADVLGWPPARTEHALTDLVSRGLAVASGGTFRTAHDLVREAALAQVPDAQRTALHAAFADKLRRGARGDLRLLMEGLEHADAAGVATADLALEIARLPQRRLLGLAGLARLGAIAERPTTDVAATSALQVELAGLAEELSDHEEACDRYAALSESLPTAAERAAAAVRAARHAVEVDRSLPAAHLLERARRDGGDNPWTLVVADALDFQRLVWLEHDAAAARPYRERASRRARELVAAVGSVDALSVAEREAYTQALDAERVALLMDDDILGMLGKFDEMVDATRGLGERHVDVKLSAFFALRFLNRWPEAETRTAAALREAQQRIYPGLVAFGAYELALAVYMQGRVAEAAELYANAQQLGLRIDKAMEVADTWLTGLRQVIDASLGDWRSAMRSLQEEADRQPNPHCRLGVRLRAAMCAARFAPAESREAVVELLVAADADAVAADCVRCLWELRVISAELFARVGELQRAMTLLDQWDATHPSPHPRAAFLRAQSGAVVAAATGQANAIDLLRVSVDAAADASLRLDQLWMLVDLGSMLVNSGGDGAIDAWTAAAQLADELGAASEEALIRRKLRDIGVRRVQTTRVVDSIRGLEALSRRELEVTRLAAGGARNSDIAESLFISAKTVEQHLSRVFAKLDVHNRTELGAKYAAALATSQPDAAVARN